MTFIFKIHKCLSTVNLIYYKKEYMELRYVNIFPVYLSVLKPPAITLLLSNTTLDPSFITISKYFDHV
jgi:hypothetical protein